MKQKYWEKGQALIEAILALGITVVIVTGIVIALISSVNNTNFTKNQNLATSYAQEGIDVARNLKDSDYDDFSLLQDFYCLDEGVTTIDQEQLESCSGNVANTFTRQLFIDQNGQDSRVDPPVQICDQSRGKSIYVVSLVSWRDTRCKGGAEDECHKIELDSCFADLNTLPQL